MTLHLGNVPAGSTLYIPFASYNSSGASASLTGLAATDIEIYKNGSVTQRASDAGYTLLDTDGIDFDGITGINGFSIDLSDNTDSGFYAVGSFYWVIVSSVTIDSQTVNLIAATFRIVAAESVAGKPKVDVDAFGGTAGTFASGRPEVNTTHAAGTAWNAGAINNNTIASAAISASTLAADTITAAKVAADVGTEIATAVWASGTRTLTALDEDSTTLDIDAAVRAAVGLASANLDTQLATIDGNVDAILVDTGTDIPASIATIDSNVDAILVDTAEIGAAGAGLTEAGGTGDHLTAIPWNASWDAEVQSEAADALAAYDPPTKAELDAAVAPLALEASLAVVDGNVDAILVDTGTTIPATLATIAGYIDTEIASIISAIATVDAVVDAIKLKTDNLPSDPADASVIAGRFDTVDAAISGLSIPSVADIWTTQLTEAYAADGVAPTGAEFLFGIQQMLMDFAISGTTLTVKKIDGTTTAMTLTLSDAMNPAGIARTG